MSDERAVSVTLTFPPEPAKQRVKAIFVNHFGWPMGVVPAVLTLMPATTLAFAGAARDTVATAAALGLGFLALVIVANVFAMILAPPPAIVLEVHGEGIRETCDSKTTEHGWPWVRHAFETPDGFEVHVEPRPLRSLRLDARRPHIFRVPRRTISTEDAELLRALLARRGLSP